MTQSRYLLDTNIFIQAKNQHYGFDFCPAFWDWLIEQNARERVASSEMVSVELKREDDLFKWVEKRGPTFFLPRDAAVLSAKDTVSEWAGNQNYKGAAISKFFAAADYWLIAHALAHNFVVVTHEKSAANAMSKIKIPDACTGLGLICIDPYEMLRRERPQFVLEPAVRQ